MSAKSIGPGNGSSSRTFTEEEQTILVMALIAYRRIAIERGEIDVLDGIIRDGWVAK